MKKKLVLLLVVAASIFVISIAIRIVFCNERAADGLAAARDSIRTSDDLSLGDRARARPDSADPSRSLPGSVEREPMQARKNFPPVFLSNDEEAKYFISHALTLTKNGVRVPNPSDAVAEIQETTVTVIFPPPKVLPDGTNPPLSRAEYHAKLKFDRKTGKLLQFLVGS